MKYPWIVGVLAMLGFAVFACRGEDIPVPIGCPTTGGLITGGLPNTGGIFSGGIPNTGGIQSTGGAGGMGGEVSPGSVKWGEDCVYRGTNRGTGGSDGIGCVNIEVGFVPALPSLDLSATMKTSQGIFLVDEKNPSPFVPSWPPHRLEFRFQNASGAYVDSPGPDTVATALTVHGRAPRGHSYPQPFSTQWIEIEVRQGGVVVGADRFELRYTCEDVTWDDWCWKAAPVVLHTTAPTPDAGL